VNTTPPPRKPKAEPMPTITFDWVGVMRDPASSEPVGVTECGVCYALVRSDGISGHAATHG
jgi:hypothetical protein